MRLAFLLIPTFLYSLDTVEVIVPGLSFHHNWDEPGEPNPWNYGLGAAYTYQKDNGDWGRVSTGAVLYKDSFNDLATVVYTGLGIRSPTTISVEALMGLAYWDGSGMSGLTYYGYAGIGYRYSEQSAVYVDGTGTADFVAVWLKFVTKL